MTLIIDEEVISDAAVVILNGREATATVFNPSDDQDFPIFDAKGNQTGFEPIGPERVARLTDAKEFQDPQRIVGIDDNTGLESTWVVQPGRGCRGC